MMIALCRKGCDRHPAMIALLKDTRLFEAGLTIEQVPLVTGHKDWKMLKRYTQLRPENLHAILARKAST